MLLHTASVRLLRLSLCTILQVVIAFGAENSAQRSQSDPCHTVALRNGFVVSYTRHEAAGQATRLWVCDGAGYIDVPADQIEAFQPDASALPAETSAELPSPGHGPATPGLDPIAQLISGAASHYQLDPDFVSSVVKAESGFNPTALSPKGAQGLMQIMPVTAASLGIGNPFDPAANLEGGTKYLRKLLDQYDGDAVKALAAYNAGPGRIKQYGGVPPYAETRAYVIKVINDYNRKKVSRSATERPARLPVAAAE